MFEDEDGRSFDELPIGTVLLRDDDGEFFEKSSRTEVTSFFFTSTGQRYENDLPIPWMGIMTRWDWVVLTAEQVNDAQQSAMVMSRPAQFPWGLIATAVVVIAVLYACFGG
jgi:hypothetical protein